MCKLKVCIKNEKGTARLKRTFFLLGVSLAFHKGNFVSVAGPNSRDIWGQLLVPVVGKRL